jgi:hypothetical protein
MVTLPWNVFITDEIRSFVKIGCCMKMKSFGFKLQKNGIDIINHRYLRGLFDDFKEKIKWLTNLQQHRLKQFYGIIAATSHLKSTKYMFMWIEEKNSNDIISVLFDLIVFYGL